SRKCAGARPPRTPCSKPAGGSSPPTATPASATPRAGPPSTSRSTPSPGTVDSPGPASGPAPGSPSTTATPPAASTAHPCSRRSNPPEEKDQGQRTTCTCIVPGFRAQLLNKLSESRSDGERAWGDHSNSRHPAYGGRGEFDAGGGADGARDPDSRAHAAAVAVASGRAGGAAHGLLYRGECDGGADGPPAGLVSCVGRPRRL